MRSRDSPEIRDDVDDDGDDGDDGGDGDDGFVSGIPFVCSLRRKNYGIVLIVKILVNASETE